MLHEIADMLYSLLWSLRSLFPWWWRRRLIDDYTPDSDTDSQTSNNAAETSHPRKMLRAAGDASPQTPNNAAETSHHRKKLRHKAIARSFTVDMKDIETYSVFSPSLRQTSSWSRRE